MCNEIDKNNNHDEDIELCAIVHSGACGGRMRPSGGIPNDEAFVGLPVSMVWCAAIGVSD